MRKFILFVVILSFSCATSNTDYRKFVRPDIKSRNAREVADITFKLSPSSHKEYYYRFAKGDTVILNAWVIKGNDLSKIEIGKYKGGVLYSFMRVPYVLNKRFIADTGGIYVFRFFNTSTFRSKVYRFTVHRIPPREEFMYFNTSVYWDTVYDTVYRWVKESTLVRYEYEPERIVFRGFVLNKGGHRCTELNIPYHTSYIVFMVGVGNAFLKEMDAVAGRSPLELFEKGRIMKPLIKSMESAVSIDYAIDYTAERAVDFLLERYSHPLYGERNIIVDFGRLSISGDCYLCVKNNSHTRDISVFEDVIAVRKKGIYTYRRVRRPFIKIRRIPR